MSTETRPLTYNTDKLVTQARNNEAFIESLNNATTEAQIADIEKNLSGAWLQDEISSRAFNLLTEACKNVRRARAQ